MTWKHLSDVLVLKMSRHAAQCMHRAQRGLGSDLRGAKHQLLVDRVVF